MMQIGDRDLISIVAELDRAPTQNLPVPVPMMREHRQGKSRQKSHVALSKWDKGIRVEDVSITGFQGRNVSLYLDDSRQRLSGEVIPIDE
jgi:hypothetical protein